MCWCRTDTSLGGTGAAKPLLCAGPPLETILENESPDAGDCMTSVSRDAFAAPGPKPSGPGAVFEPARNFFILTEDRSVSL
jgi:hypothetical protein